MAESKIQSQILKHLDSIGAYSIKTISTNKRGCPDILCCYKGKFIGIEVKDKGKLNQVKPLQQYHIDLINEKGGVAFAADSLETVQKKIKELEIK